jgi:hypothetical protein
LRRFLLGAVSSSLSSSLLLVGGSATSAAPNANAITGRLSAAGYTVLAVASNGRVTSARAPSGRFSIRPPASRVTLHLRAPDGAFAGPIAVASERRGTRAILGVRAGAKLGRISVRSAGYAKVIRAVPKKSRDRTRWARARKGVPIGTGTNFGFVRAAPLRAPPPGDRDADGVPDVLDVDLDGDRILNSFDRTGGASLAFHGASVGAQTVPTKVFGSPVLDLNPEDTVNANAGTADPQLEAALPTFGSMYLGITGIAPDPSTQVELDCGNADTGLVYCRKNGSTGRLNAHLGGGLPPGTAHGDPYPGCCDPDGNGFGSLTHNIPPGGVPIYFVPIRHHATASQVGTGDLFVVRASIGGAAREFAGTLQFVSQTVPAVTSFSDGQGTSATISYPISGGPLWGPGTRENPYPIKAGPTGDVVVTLTFWRPQRRPLPGEAGSWIDIGRSYYTVSISDIGLRCPEGAYATSDANLTPFRPGPFPFGYLDSAGDQEANPANTLIFTINLTRCLADRGLPFAPGDKRGIDLAATPSNVEAGGPPPRANTRLWFTRSS